MATGEAAEGAGVGPQRTAHCGLGASPTTQKQQALFAALAGRQAEIDRFFGVVTGAVPLADYLSPRNLLQLLGPRAMARLALGRLRGPRQGDGAAHPGAGRAVSTMPGAGSARPGSRRGRVRKPAGDPGGPLRPPGLPRTPRRPSGQPPPLPHHLQLTGVGWLTAAVVLAVASLVVFAGGWRGPSLAITVLDAAVVGWLAGLRVPGLVGAMQALAALGSWTAIGILLWGLLLVLLVLRRLRQLVVVLVAWTVQGFITTYLLAPLVQRPRPFGVPFRTDWFAWALPSQQLASLATVLVGILYGLVPEGRWRNIGKWVATAVVVLVAVAQLYLGVAAPTDILVGVAIGVAVPLLGFRWFAPSQVFPISYRRGRAAHLDVGGARGQAIRQALHDQLGLVVTEVEPFGLAGSAGSTPLRIRVKGDPDTWLFGKLYARSHLRADRWYKLGRELLYGRLEDEKPFNTVRRLVQQEDYALQKLYLAGLPTPRPYGIVELTPEREYLLVTEFFAGATELGEAEVDDQVIDDGLSIVRRLWEAGLAHRDIKPANLLVRDGRMLLIDVFFTEVRPTPWRQGVDLANMMLCLALRSSPERVYERALRQFSVEEISEGFAAARGLACPPSCGGCCASRDGACTPRSCDCCRPGPGRSGSSAGAPAGSRCCCWSFRWRCCSSRPCGWCWASTTSRPPASRS
jgi:membrane-associated phospholipid phosphatase/tRNA A-37 threonylcarbamoyl transferase component Bud32